MATLVPRMARRSGGLPPADCALQATALDQLLCHPKETIMHANNSVVVMAHGSTGEVADAKEILAGAPASRVDVHLAPAAKNVPVAVHA
jgi:hypothetical protein